MDKETREVRDSLVQSLIAIRESVGMSQEEIAKRMNVSQPRISEFESLSDRRVYLDTAIDYARAVGAEIRISGRKISRSLPIRPGRPSRHRSNSERLGKG